MKIQVQFFGRKIGAIGISSDFRMSIDGIPSDATREEIEGWLLVTVYETHEHIGGRILWEIADWVCPHNPRHRNDLPICSRCKEIATGGES